MQDEDSTNQWQGSDRRGMSEEKLRHVNDHLTPLAAIIVIPGLLVAPLPTRAAVVAGVLIAFSVILNYVSIYLMDRHVRLIGTVRGGRPTIFTISSYRGCSTRSGARCGGYCF